MTFLELSHVKKHFGAFVALDLAPPALILFAVVDALADEPGVDVARIGICGTSRGG